MIRTLASGALLLLLVGCGGSSGPQIRIFDGSSVPSGGQSTTRTTGGFSDTVISGDQHRVQRGETLYSISRRYGVPLRSLIVENSLDPPYELQVGQVLRLPKARVHTVRAGETVYGISRQYNVAMNELVRVNGIQSPFTIKVGQTLAIPASTQTQRTVVSVSPSAPSPTTGAPRPEAKPSTPGTATQVPSPATPAPQPTPAPEPVTQAPVKVPDLPSYDTAGLPHPYGKPAPPPRLVGPIPQPPALTGDGFLWPVRGKVVSNYGPKGKGLHNDGINIAAPRGSAIRASENGVVAYAGDGLQGFGNIVLVKHADGYVTAYAHADTLLVTRGQVITRGQAIAKVGSTGTVDSPQVHFQIRKGREALDPRRFLLTS